MILAVAVSERQNKFAFCVLFAFQGFKKSEKNIKNMYTHVHDEV